MKGTTVTKKQHIERINTDREKVPVFLFFSFFVVGDSRNTAKRFYKQGDASLQQHSPTHIGTTRQMSRLESLQQDNASLEHEITLLHQKKAELMKQIEKSKKKRPLGPSFEQLKKDLIGTPKKKTSSPKKQDKDKRKRMKHDDYLSPEPIQHEFFDESISKYFTRPKKQTVTSNEYDDEKINNVILENVYRMFGITAFPVKDPSRKHIELLGIRIEIFNALELRFETPHYIILERNVKNDKWIVFKHTIPTFVQLDKLSMDGFEDSELLNFLQLVRQILNKTSLKHQVVDKLSRDMRKHVKRVQKDISMENLKFSIVVDDKESNVVMKCGLDSILSCSVQDGFSVTECSRIAKVLKGDFNSLQMRLETVVESMADDEI